MRIAIFSQWFDPEPTPKGLVYARRLVEMGHDVEVITGFPNYPGGKVYDGYRIRLIQREVIDGVHVTRVPLYPSHDRSAMRRILNYVSFMLSAMTYGLFRMKRPDIMYVYHPPATTGVAAALVGFFRRIPFVYDIQDLWPDTLAATGMLERKRVLGFIGAVCNWIYRRAAHVVVLSDGFRRLLVKRGVPDEKLTVIHNWCDESAITLDGPEAELPDGFNVLFAGNIGFAQAMDAVLDAAALVANDDKRINVILLGSGIDVDRLKRRVAESGPNNVVFLPRVPMSEVGSYLRAADALLVHLKDDELFRITIPSKTQAYMSIGKPVLMAVRGDAAAMIEAAVAGITAIPEDANSIADALRRFAAMDPDRISVLGMNARQYYQRELSVDCGVARFVDVFYRVLGFRSGAREKDAA